ncbi:MAG: mechanosensitive ion channel [Rubrivivax sp.]|nr:mechanosensitive ion channel [Rubrivivax sp.]
MEGFLATLWREDTPWIGAVALLAGLVLWRRLPGGREAVRPTLLMLLVWVVVDLVAAAFALRGQVAMAKTAHQLAVLGFGLVLIRLAGLAVFRLLLPRLSLQMPRIVEDIGVIAGYGLWGLVRLSHAGVDLTSLVATSAVVTAVVAFAMQDTLGNILGGMALQLDDSFEIGDWLKLDDVSGQVVEIQWRFTALRTRNGERVVVPNGQLMKGKFSVVPPPSAPGAATWRRWIWFNLEAGLNPSGVIAAAERAVTDASIPNVAQHPPPSCVAMEFGPGYVRYALRYWLSDPNPDDVTDSAVRVHLLAQLERCGWRLALPDQAVHLVQDGAPEREAAWQRELAQRLKALAAIDLFQPLDDIERRRIAERLVHAPFVRGDVMTHQGATAHWLYIIASGEAEVWRDTPAGRQLLVRLGAGQFFGEMGLMTGAPRFATVTAATDVACYRLDKAGFEDILRQRPVLARHISELLAQRQQANEARLAGLEPPSAEPGRSNGRGAQLLERMREFFGLG